MSDEQDNEYLATNNNEETNKSRSAKLGDFLMQISDPDQISNEEFLVSAYS